MKMMLLASAALAFAAPAMAQDMTQPNPAAPATQAAPAPAPAADTMAPAPAPAADPAATAATDPNAPTPTGGYQPTTPPLSGTPVAGQNVIVQPSVAPSQAFPPPAPLAEYPRCKKGQTDKCMQRGG